MRVNPREEAKLPLLLSVIVPSRNPGIHMRELLDWATSLPDIEVIVVDDASTDGSREVLQEHITRHREGSIRLTCGLGLGPGVARNTGLAAANGTFVAFSDVDDLTHLTALRRGAQTCALAGADVVVCGYEKVNLADGARQRFPAPRRDYGKRLQGTESLLDRASVWGKIYRRSFLIENAVSFPSARGAEDVKFSYEVAMLRPKTIFCPEVAYEYRVSRRGQLTGSRAYFENGVTTLLEMLDLPTFEPWQKMLLAYTVLAAIPHVSRGVAGWAGVQAGFRLGARCLVALGPCATWSGLALGIRNHMRRRRS